MQEMLTCGHKVRAHPEFSSVLRTDGKEQPTYRREESREVKPPKPRLSPNPPHLGEAEIMLPPPNSVW